MSQVCHDKPQCKSNSYPPQNSLPCKASISFPIKRSFMGREIFLSFPFACLQCVYHLSTGIVVNHKPSKYSSDFSLSYPYSHQKKLIKSLFIVKTLPVEIHRQPETAGQKGASHSAEMLMWQWWSIVTKTCHRSSLL